MKFKSDIEVQAGLKDSSGSSGASGQILSSTNGNVSWVTPTVNTVARDVQNQVKAGVAINKGQAVYVTGADGTNIIVGLASNTTEATSSKTLGLLNATVAINGFADVVQIGKLAGLNTSAATVGDPVWLGTNGNLIYGLANKPYAPAHLVFIGVVTRVNANNGEIFVTVQNGFELNEIHDVDLKTNVPVNGEVLGYNGTLWVNKTIAGWLGYTPLSGTGTANFVPKWDGTTSLTNSRIIDNGSGVYVGYGSVGSGSAWALDVIAVGSTQGGMAVRNLVNNAPVFRLDNLGIGDFIQARDLNTSSDVFLVDYLGNTTAKSFIKSGGTADQILAANGSVITAGTGISISGGVISSTVVGGVTSFNTRTGAVTLTSGDVTAALGYTPTNVTANPVNPNGLSVAVNQVLNLALSSASATGALSSTDWNTFNSKQTALNGTGFVKISGTTISYDNSAYTPTSRTITINGVTQDLSANQTWTVAGGVTSFNTRTGAVTLTSGDVTTALGYTPVTNARTLTINGVGYDLSADRSWTVTAVETDTLATVTGRGAATSTLSYFTGGLGVDAGQLKFNENGVRSWNVQAASGSLNFTSGDSLGEFTFNGGVNVLTTRDSALVLRAMDGGTSPWNYINYLNSAGTRKYYVGTDTSNVFNIYSDDGTGYVYSNTSFRAPVFYDSNNTAYYLDPASTSNLNVLQTAGTGLIGGILSIGNSTNTKIKWGGNTTPTLGLPFSGAANALWLEVNDGDTGGIAIDNEGVTVYGAGDTGYVFRAIDEDVYQSTLNVTSATTFQVNQGQNGGGYIRGVLNVTDYLIADNSARSPIFYDSNNTGFYLDPASTSNLNGLSLTSASTFLGGLSIVRNGGGSDPYGVLAVSCPSGDNYSYIGMTRNGIIGLGMGIDTSNNFWIGGTGGGHNAVRTSTNILINSGGVQSPVFYDLNNTGYYVDPASTSNTNVMLAYQYQGNGNVGGTGAASWHPSGIYCGSTMWQYGDMYKNNSSIYDIYNGFANSSLRAPIFYDQNNTGWYVDPASTSNLWDLTLTGGSNKYLYINPGNGYEAMVRYNGGSGNTWYSGKRTTSTTQADTSGFHFYSDAGGDTVVGFGTDGTIKAKGDVVAYASSDRQLKDNILPIENALEKVKQIGGYTFDWNDKQTIYKGHDVGVIAQEIESVLPEVVTTRDTGFKAVKYEKIVPLLIEAIKEQQTQIEELKELVNKLINK